MVIVSRKWDLQSVHVTLIWDLILLKITSRLYHPLKNSVDRDNARKISLTPGQQNLGVNKTP